MNFVRNRQQLKRFAFAIFWKCRYADCCTSIEAEIQSKREQNRRAQIKKEKRRQFKQRNEIKTSEKQAIEIEAKEPEIIIRKQPSMICTKVASNSLPISAEDP